jgi:aromatic ring-opening dioxygenase catalytic subunit (LigB family)
VLVVGSGMSFHNLRQFNKGGPASLAFHTWLDEVLKGDCAERARHPPCPVESGARWPRFTPA